ncbi:hypothetical protein C0J52_02808 [Blattella germanica]|nr:hypothetical protein C0J52_02808 [Blattella germanica]
MHLIENYRDSLRIISRNADIDSFNYAELRKNNNPVAIINAIHNNRTASEATADEAMGLQKHYDCLLVLKSFYNKIYGHQGDSLCNGTLDEIKDIVYKPGEQDNQSNLPLCIMVHFPRYTGPVCYGNTIPIVPFSVSFKKINFPIQLAYVISIHRSQGIILEKAVIDIGPNEFALVMTYVALSRVKAIDGLILDPSFLWRRLEAIKSHEKDYKKRNKN